MRNRTGKIIKFTPKESIYGWIGGKRKLFFGTNGAYEGELLTGGDLISTPIGTKTEVIVNKKLINMIGFVKSVPK